MRATVRTSSKRACIGFFARVDAHMRHQVALLTGSIVTPGHGAGVRFHATVNTSMTFQTISFSSRVGAAWVWTNEMISLGRGRGRDSTEAFGEWRDR